MKIFVFFHIENGMKKICLMFVNRLKAERFMQKNRHLYMETWEAIT